MTLHSCRSSVCWVVLGGLVGSWGLTGCAGNDRSSVAPSALEVAVADDEGLGDPRRPPKELDADEAQALLEDPSATRLDFDGVEDSDAPTDRIVIPPDRTPMPSMMQEITLGPSS